MAETPVLLIFSICSFPCLNFNLKTAYLYKTAASNVLPLLRHWSESESLLQLYKKKIPKNPKLTKLPLTQLLGNAWG